MLREKTTVTHYSNSLARETQNIRGGLMCWLLLKAVANSTHTHTHTHTHTRVCGWTL